MGYSGKIIDIVVEQTTSRKSIKFFGPKKYLVYIRLPYFGQASELFTHRLPKDIENIYHTIKPIPVFGTIKHLSVTNKDVSPTHEKSNIIYKFSCHCGHLWLPKISLKTNPTCAKNNQKVYGGGEKPDKSYFSAIGKHFLDNPDFAANYSEVQTSV